MKTRLLLLMIFISSFANAQVTFGNPYATAITTTTATLNCTVSLNNTYQISYQIALSEAAINSGANQESANRFAGFYNLSYNRTNLLPNTTYYFRCRALAFGVYTNSAIGSFTTPALVPIISGVSSSSITTNGATLNYTLNAQGSNTTSYIKYGLTVAMTSTVSGASATGTTNAVGSTLLTGLTPNRQYYFQVVATNANGITTSEPIGTFTTSTIFPIISAISVSVTQTTATVNYTLNANGSNATSKGIRFQIVTDQEVIGATATGTTSTPGSITFTGLTPNTLYNYFIEATNSNGTERIGGLTFITAGPPQLITEYTFDNTPNNVNGNAPFSHLFGMSYTADRNGNPNKALSLTDNGATATITGLPYGSNSRTISFWAKTTTLNTFFNYVFHYGDTANGNGFLFKPTQSIFFAGSGGNNTITTSHTNNTWYHYVCTYDGTTSKTYKDGTLISSASVTWNTVNNSNIFRLGLTEQGSIGFFTGAIDDLKIYNYALSQTDITNLYNNNTLSSTDFSQNNLKVTLYPNPVKDILNIETETEIKSVEIYNLLGQKVKTAKSINVNVADLSNGTYLVRVQDTNNAVETMKIVKQ